jgi:peptidoglycan/xylan/chitin deacetylase (PgdA/CDA1 family)
MKRQIKHWVQGGIRVVHTGLLKRSLPDKIGIYFHYLDPAFYGALYELVGFFRMIGYRFATPEDFLQDPDEQCVFLSIDDNYRSSYEALSVFEQLKVPLTVYLNTRYFRDTADPADIETYFARLEFDGPHDLLSTSEVQAISEAGHVIGAHTHSHYDLTTLAADQARAEILQSKNHLEQILNTGIRHFSYPFGMRRHFNEELRTFCRDIGFQTVANAIPALQYKGQAPFALQRSVWHLDKSLNFNLNILQIDGQWFEHLTGRSAVG